MSLSAYSAKALLTTVSVLTTALVTQLTYDGGSMAVDFARNKYTLWNSKNSKPEFNPIEENGALECHPSCNR